MKQLRCNKPGCGNTFGEGTPEFEDGFCSCGAALSEVTNEEVAVKSINEIINDEAPTPRFIDELEELKPIEIEELMKLSPEEEEFIQSVGVDVQVDEKQLLEEQWFEEQQDTSKKMETLEDPNLPTYIIGKNNEVIYKQDEAYAAEFNNLFGDRLNSDYKGDRIEFILHGQVVRTYPLEYDEFLIGREHDGVVPDIDYTNFDENRYISRRHALVYRQQNEYFIRNLSTKNSVHVNKEVLKEKEFRCLQDGDRIVLSRKFGLVFKKKSESEHI